MHNIILRVLTSDLGASNVGMWKAAGININDSVLSHTEHPCNAAEHLYFMADVPHLLKNIRNSLENQTMILPQDIVLNNNLPCREVSIMHIETIVNMQEKMELKISTWVIPQKYSSRTIW